MPSWLDWIMGRKPKPPKPPKPIPAPPLSVDGDHIVAGDGKSLYTAEGTWTFGNGGQPGGWAILLNGASAAGGSAVELWIENGGQVYALNSAAAWFVWSGGGWWQTTDPHPQPIPPEPIPPEPEPEPEPEPPNPEPGPGPGPIPTVGLVAVLDLSDGRSITYAEVDAVTLGSGTNPYTGKNQFSAYLVRDELEYMSVHFRRGGTKPEIIFLWGRVDANGKEGATATLPAYRVTIFEGGIQQGEPIQVVPQIWLTRWRWPVRQYEPVHMTGAQLLAADVVPPIVPGIATQGPVAPATPYAPLGTSDWTVYWPMTGFHRDIGPMPEILGAYLGGDVSLEASVLDLAEAANSFPVCIVDPWNGMHVWDWRQYPNASFDGRQYLSGIEPKLSAAYDSSGGMTIDSAHAPCVPFLAAAMTGDLYFLEITQMMANWIIGSDPYPLGGLVRRCGQTRGAAWGLQNLTMAWKITKHFEERGAIIPPWLQPSSYFGELLAKNAADIIANYVDNPSTKTALLNSATNPDSISFWQEAYFTIPVGLLARWGAPGDWAKIEAWKIKAITARYNGVSGWPKTRPHIPEYSGYVVEGSWLNIVPASPTPPWAQLAELQTVSVGPSPDGQMIIVYDYPLHDRAALALSAANGNQEALACFEYVDSELRRQGSLIYHHFAFGP